MIMKNKTDKLHSYLKIFFWSNIIILTGVFVFLLQIKGPEFGHGVEKNIIFERYAIIFTMIAIPGALKLFSVLINKRKDLPADKFLKEYIKIYVLRAIIMDTAVIVNLIGFYMYEASNFVYLSVIAIFALCFSFPGKGLMYKEEVHATAESENNIEINDKEEEL